MERFGPGTVLLGKYRVESLLGRGGMGLVLRVTHLHLGEALAIKVLMPAGAAEPDLAARFLREAQAAARLRGEHVTRVVDIGMLPDGLPYMVMEYLRGSDLSRELMRRKQLPVGEAVDYVLQACEALAEAHANGIVHRDIKPGNLFLTTRPDGTPLLKVLDFGISKAQIAANVLTKTDVVMGTAGYMSPEQMKAAKDVDARTDIWALGSVLYECLAGRRPFEGETFSAVVLMAGTEPPPPLDSKLPRGLQSAVLRCLEKDRKARFPSIAALAAALAPFARDQRAAATVVDRTNLMLRRPGSASDAPLQALPSPTAATVDALSPVTGSRVKRNIVFVSAALVALFVVAGIIGTRSQPGNRPEEGTGSGVSPPSVAIDANNDVDKAAVNVAVTPTAPTPPTVQVDTATVPPTADDEVARKVTGCVELNAQRKWQALLDCANGLVATTARDKGIALKNTAVRETINERADGQIRQDLKNGSFKEAQAELKKMGADSVYFHDLSELFDKFDLPNLEEARHKIGGYLAGHDCVALRHFATQQQTGATGTERVVALVREGLAKCTGKASGDVAVVQPNPGTGSNAGGNTGSAPVAPSPNKVCDTMSVEDMMNQAANQYNSGYADAALLVVTKVLACKQDVRMYRLAALYACAAHDPSSAKAYFNKVPTQYQLAIIQKCQLEKTPLDVSSE